MKSLFCGLLLVALTMGCQRDRKESGSAVEPEPHPESYTNWTTKTELFAEYPPLVAGQVSRFAVHLTRLDTFKPVTQGRVEIRLTSPSGEVESFTTDSASRPGIWGVDVRTWAAGEFKLSIHLVGDGLNDVHELGSIESSATKAAAVHEHGEETEETIAFLKEQQWTLDFGTAVIEDRQLRTSLRVPAEVLPRSGGEAEVSLPFDGRLVASRLPIIGERVGQGQVIASLLPPTSTPSDLASLELTRTEASLALQLARKDRERAERLVQSGAIAAKRLEEAKTMEATMEARLRAAESKIAQYDSSSSAETNPEGTRLFALRAPISGIVTETRSAPGANMKAGQALLKILDIDTVYVSAIVPEAEMPQIRYLGGAELEIPGNPQPRLLTRLVSIGRIVDPLSRTFPVIYQFDNRDRSVAIHQTLHARLLTKSSNAAPAVPESAIVDDGGRPVIFLQQSGEAFLRRPVKVGIREGGFVQILEGAFPGERVVTRGAHLIRLAAMSNQVPAHGHVH
jgi:membrane fusion protein, heavy metal efflux system